jgi:hypothetical protein
MAKDRVHLDAIGFQSDSSRLGYSNTQLLYGGDSRSPEEILYLEAAFEWQIFTIRTNPREDFMLFNLSLNTTYSKSQEDQK